MESGRGSVASAARQIDGCRRRFEIETVASGARLPSQVCRSDMLLAVIDEAWARTEVSFGSHSPESSSFEDRVDMIVDRYRVSFNDYLFPAILDIFHGLREDPVLFERIGGRFPEILDERAQRWANLFADLDIPAERLRPARDILRSTTRGLALSRILGSPVIQ